MWSLSECIPWMTVGLAESVAIVTLNLCTIIVFIRNPILRKRSTYLVMNLAVVDMLAGGFAVNDLFYDVGVRCNVWKADSFEDWAYYIYQTLLYLFPYSSLTNIAIIALERLHATFYPFRHRVLKNWVYGVIIAIVWVTSGLVAITNTLLLNFMETLHYQFAVRVTLFSICLLIICVSYTSIVMKVRCGAQPQHHGAASRERKLTMTLLIVTVVSLLSIFPYVIIVFIILSSNGESWLILSDSPVSFYLQNAIVVLLYANSLVNPILYAIRMPEYRSALLALFRKRPQQQRQAAVLSLRNM